MYDASDHLQYILPRFIVENATVGGIPVYHKGSRCLDYISCFCIVAHLPEDIMEEFSVLSGLERCDDEIRNILFQII